MRSKATPGLDPWLLTGACHLGMEGSRNLGTASFQALGHALQVLVKHGLLPKQWRPPVAEEWGLVSLDGARGMGLELCPCCC
jgi:hypothetical protein